MIPKIIHLCWLSGDPFPTDIVKCLETWNDKLKGYTIWLWGKAPSDLSVIKDLKVEVKNFDLNSTIWTKQAFEAKKYAFAADYIRLYALYNYGGIYLDADVLVYKSFDELLELPYFVGCDQIGAFEAAVIGAEKGHQWINDVFERYTERPFIKDYSSYDMLSLPVVFHDELVAHNYRFKKVYAKSEFKEESKTIEVFDKDFFNSRNAIEVQMTPKSFCAHNYAGSWTKKSSTLKDKVKQILPKRVVKGIYVIGQMTWARNKYASFQIPFKRT